MTTPTRIKATTKLNARTLRQKMTDAEKLLWHHLRMKQFDEHKFRRQHPIGKYIADFVCPEANLILEIDGGQHMEQSDSDAIRTRWLETKGFRVMRFWNDEVLGNIEGVKLVIWNYLSTPLPPSRTSKLIPSPLQEKGQDGGRTMESRQASTPSLPLQGGGSKRVKVIPK